MIIHDEGTEKVGVFHCEFYWDSIIKIFIYFI